MHTIKYCLVVFHISLLVTVHAQTKSAAPVTLSNVLSSLYDVSQLPLYMDNTVSAQVSSYDITGGNDDGFSGKNSFIRRRADSSLVIFEIKGAGVINRIWTPTPTEDTVDFYFDGKPKPGLSVKYSDLFSGHIQPFTAPLCGNDLGGFYCYFPVLFNNGCIIVCRGKKMQFHQIQYRLYPPGTNVKTFSAALSPADTTALNTIKTLWTNTGGNFYRISNAMKMPATHSELSKGFELSPGKDAVLFSTSTGGHIEGIQIGPAAAFESLAKLVDIEITWDDDKTPAVYCPLADFFGYAFGKPAMQSLLLGTSKDINYCYIPMPFDKKATIRLRYRVAADGEPPPALRITSTIYYNEKKRDPATEGRFYTSWNRVTADGQPHTILQTNARGHFIGTILQAQGLRPGMTYFFEGDDSTVVDGTMRMHGTGSEDYFNGGWYALTDRWDGKLSLPLHGCLDYSLPYCRTGAYRFYLSDKISFAKNIFHSIEHGPAGNKIPADYTSLGFYYADAAPAAAVAPANELTSVYVPDTLVMYPQLMRSTIENNIAVATAWKYSTGGLSYTYTVNDESGVKIDIGEIPLGNYKLLLDFVRNETGAEFSAWMGQHNMSGWLAGHAAAEQILQNFFIANIKHTASRNSISIHFKTAAGRNTFILNRLIFIRM